MKHTTAPLQGFRDVHGADILRPVYYAAYLLTDDGKHLTSPAELALRVYNELQKYRDTQLISLFSVRCQLEEWLSKYRRSSHA